MGFMISNLSSIISVYHLLSMSKFFFESFEKVEYKEDTRKIPQSLPSSVHFLINLAPSSTVHLCLSSSTKPKYFFAI